MPTTETPTEFLKRLQAENERREAEINLLIASINTEIHDIIAQYFDEIDRPHKERMLRREIIERLGGVMPKGKR